MLACKSFPGVICGLVVDPSDAYLFSQINNGNAVSLPYAKGFGWGAELNLENLFTQPFKEEGGRGYPSDRVVPQQRNKKILDAVKEVTYNDLISILKGLDQDLVKGAISGAKFQEYFFANSKDAELTSFIKSLLA